MDVKYTLTSLYIKCTLIEMYLKGVSYLYTSKMCNYIDAFKMYTKMRTKCTLTNTPLLHRWISNIHLH